MGSNSGKQRPADLAQVTEPPLLRPYTRPTIRASRAHSVVLDGNVSATSEPFMSAGGPAKKAE